MYFQVGNPLDIPETTRSGASNGYTVIDASLPSQSEHADASQSEHAEASLPSQSVEASPTEQLPSPTHVDASLPSPTHVDASLHSQSVPTSLLTSE